MKLWVDDLRPAPSGYVWVRSVVSAIDALECNGLVEEINLDHDAGDYAKYGGDYIKILDWMEEHNVTGVKVKIHSMNPVGVYNMRQIVLKNGWE